MKNDGSLPFKLLGNGIRGLFHSFMGIQVTLLGTGLLKIISLGVLVLLLWTECH